MKLVDDAIRLSASDLSNHLGCRYLTWLDLRVATGQMGAPDHHDPRLESLQQRGFQHEKAYLEHLEDQGRTITRLPKDVSVSTGFEETVAAMRAGDDVIVQATLMDDRWLGYADVLQRVDTSSRLGDWSYEVVDTKLARETRAGTILQLCLYSDIVGKLQGGAAEYMHVVSPGRDFEPESHRVLDYAAYYRYVCQRLEVAVDVEKVGEEPCYPEPVPQCDICRWWADCRDRRRRDDHLSLVAGISRLQIRELQEHDTTTVEALAEVPIPLQWKPQRGTAASLEQVREQARVQVEGRLANAPIHELLPPEPERGFARLPAPSPGDIFFDIEGGRFVGEDGLEYLLAFVHLDDDTPAYEHRWAVDTKGERKTFEWFVDTVMERWARDPGMHIYHYAPYEPSALKRLMGRYATREDEVDRMLRGGLFVDLYHVVRQAVRASVESYSLKDLEPFYGSGGAGGFERSVDLREATLALRRVEHALELGDDIDPEDPDFAAVLAYNRDDCISTLRLRDWLEQLRTERVAAGDEIPRPPLGEPERSDAASERQQEIDELKARLVASVPEDPTELTDEDKARMLLAEMLEFHRRESKAPWWEFFRLLDLTELELLEEKAAVVRLEFVKRVDMARTRATDRYHYPEQDMEVRRGEVVLQNGEKFGDVVEADRAALWIDIKKVGAMKDVHPSTLISRAVVPTKTLAKSLFRLGERVVEHGLKGHNSRVAAVDLLLRRMPRLSDGASLHGEDETLLDGARRIATRIDASYVPIQGPPGAGKTYTGAHMIGDLVRAGKKVGVTAVSHKVIDNLLCKVAKFAADVAVCGHKVSRLSDMDPEKLKKVEFVDNGEAYAALNDGEVNVLGGTAWLWSGRQFEDSVDVLFVDEAGQMALANVLAVAPAARNLVLLGDPQQLEQPQQGSHPEGTDVSALDHILGDHQTMPNHRGLFLDETWRLHPKVCSFTSEVFYENRLSSRPNLTQQTINTARARGSGLWFVPVEHSGNQSSSLEEAVAVGSLVDELLSGDPTWIDQDGKTSSLGLKDVLIVAPYNAQVAVLRERIPNANVGTVDRFQGQEAPIVIYSMATSSPEVAPRGMEFLYNPNRLNVATSRARCAVFLVANPRVFAAECRSPAQMKLANAFCRYAEMASLQPADAAAD